jgi:hypothetical protein
MMTACQLSCTRQVAVGAAAGAAAGSSEPMAAASKGNAALLVWVLQPAVQ